MDATSNNLLTYRNKITGAEFAQPVYTSLDITNLADKSLLGDFALTAIKTEFDCDITPAQPVDHFADLVDDLPWEKADKPTKAKKVTK